MKDKLVLIILLALPFNNLLAQHRLSFDRNAYRAADQMIKQQVEFIDPGNSGKGVVWRFNMLQPINENYPLHYFIPDSTKMNILCGQEHNTRYYFRQQSDSLWALGFENLTTIMKYQKPELKLKFPLCYGDTLFSRFEGVGQYGQQLNLSVKGYTRVHVDAVGDLDLPCFETIKNALRVHTQRHYTETGKDSMEMDIDTYAWYAKGIRYPVFESIKTCISRRYLKTNENTQDTTVFTTSFYYPPEKQISEIQTDPIPENNMDEVMGAASVFTEAKYTPNPVETNLYLSYKLTRPAQVWFTLHNNVGLPLLSSVKQNLSEGNNSEILNMSGLRTGIYTLYVHVDDMVLQKNVIKK
jgi:hypothetical protein